MTTIIMYILAFFFQHDIFSKNHILYSGNLAYTDNNKKKKDSTKLSVVKCIM